jgi:pheromone shutdown protein TraB
VAASTAADANSSSSSSSGQTAVRPGIDFRAANECAEAIGAEIVLGDRPIEITLKRAWEALTLLEKAKLVVGLAMAVAGTSKASKQVSMDVVSSCLQAYRVCTGRTCGSMTSVYLYRAHAHICV